MEERRRYPIINRTTAANDAALHRLVERKHRLAALLRASRRVIAPKPTSGFRSAYATRLWDCAAHPGGVHEPAVTLRLVHSDRW